MGWGRKKIDVRPGPSPWSQLRDFDGYLDNWCTHLSSDHFTFLGNCLRGLFVSWGGWREGKKKARGRPTFPLFPSSPARYLFFDYCYVYWDTQRKPLRRREEVAVFWIISLENFRRAVSPDTTKCPCRVSEVDLDPSRSENEHLWVVHLIAKSWFNFVVWPPP